jgi:radical SAM protein with 4Fe4S-binding SPASM domain
MIQAHPSIVPVPSASGAPGTSPTPGDHDAPPLRLLFWETTAACNLACVHCRRLDVSRQLSQDDLTTQQAIDMLRALPQIGRPIVVFSGGEPLMRPDVFDLAAEARAFGLPTALATNGTIMNETVAQRIVDVGIRRVSMSFDGPDAATHDGFRGIDGAFDSSIRGFKALKSAGMSMQINTSISRHNFNKLDRMYDLAMELGADALHIFMLVPVGCGMQLSENIMLKPEEYEQALNWIYDRSEEKQMHLKATCAPHYFRVRLQRDKAKVGPKTSGPVSLGGHPHATRGGHPGGHPGAGGHPHSNLGGHPGDMTAMTKGCLAGQAVCFVSHTGEVFPCGYLPMTSGNVKREGIARIWRDSAIFHNLRHDEKLQGKCGLCEYKKVCMGCRARAYGTTGNYLAEEPNCRHIPLRVVRQQNACNCD